MENVKISFEHAFYNPYHKRKKGSGHCLRCGKELKDELSLARGYGPRCWRMGMIMIFHIPGTKKNQ
jgi:hypothetical protein